MVAGGGSQPGQRVHIHSQTFLEAGLELEAAGEEARARPRGEKGREPDQVVPPEVRDRLRAAILYQVSCHPLPGVTRRPPPALLLPEPRGCRRAKVVTPGGSQRLSGLRRVAGGARVQDEHVLVINKAARLAVQGGSKGERHLDGMLHCFSSEKGGERARLVHRLDRDTSGCLVLGRTRHATAELARAFKVHSARARALCTPLCQSSRVPCQGCWPPPCTLPLGATWRAGPAPPCALLVSVSRIWCIITKQLRNGVAKAPGLPVMLSPLAATLSRQPRGAPLSLREKGGFSRCVARTFSQGPVAVPTTGRESVQDLLGDRRFCPPPLARHGTHPTLSAANRVALPPSTPG